jgi:hypothetical protein
MGKTKTALRLAPAGHHVAQRVELLGPPRRELLVYRIAVGKAGMGRLRIDGGIANVYHEVLAHVGRVIQLEVGRLQGLLRGIALRVFNKVLIKTQKLFLSIIGHHPDGPEGFSINKNPLVAVGMTQSERAH